MDVDIEITEEGVLFIALVHGDDARLQSKVLELEERMSTMSDSTSSKPNKPTSDGIPRAPEKFALTGRYRSRGGMVVMNVE